MSWPRALLCLLVLPAALAALAGPAQGEEIFILDNGEVLRGWVVRDGDESVRVRLAGFAGEAHVDIPRERIVRRFLRVEPPKWVDGRLPTDWVASTTQVPSGPDAAQPTDAGFPLALVAEEPPAAKESFFQRLARVTILAIPPSPEGRAAAGLFLLVALLVLVLLGGRIAEIEMMGFARALMLAVLLGSFLAADVWYRSDILRADRAIWVLPTQGVAWLASAMLLLRVGLARTILLFSFVLFAVAVVVFAAGAILVSF